MSRPSDSRLSPPDVPAPGSLSQVVFWVTCWVLLTGLWLLLTGKLEAPELVAGAVAAAAGATVTTAMRLQRLFSFRLRLRWAFGLWRLPLQAVLDTGILTAALWRRLVMRRPVSGSFRAVPFRATGEEPEAIGRRVVAKGAISFAPNTYVIDIDQERGLILIHQLVPRPGDQSSIDPLGLG